MRWEKTHDKHRIVNLEKAYKLEVIIKTNQKKKYCIYAFFINQEIVLMAKLQTKIQVEDYLNIICEEELL